MMLIKSSQTMRGDQRLGSCFDLARMDLKSSLVTEITTQVKGELNVASEGTAEAGDLLVTKSVREEFEGQVRGLKSKEEYFDRYFIGDTESIDFFVLGAISKSDYERLKSSLVQKLSNGNGPVAEALRKRQAEFFKSSALAGAKRTVTNPDPAGD